MVGYAAPNFSPKRTRPRRTTISNTCPTSDRRSWCCLRGSFEWKGEEQDAHLAEVPDKPKERAKKQLRAPSSLKSGMRDRNKKTGDKESAVSDSGGGDVSLSVEETNKLRVSLGLKPLEEKKEDKIEQRITEEDKKKEKTAEIREKLQHAKEKRKEEEFFALSKALGEPGSDSDEDLAAWIEKSRTSKPLVDEKKPEETQITEKDEKFSEKSDDEPEMAPELVGTKVRHKPDDIQAGETMILTLADQPILTEAGELNVTEDALENALKAEDTRRKKAYAASKPKKDEAFDDFGDRKSLLSKYDEEEEEAMTLDPLGGFALDSVKPGASVMQESLETFLRPMSDFMSTDLASKEEQGLPTKRKRQKLRKKKEAGVLDIVGQLEATKEESMDWQADHGSRVERKNRIEREEQNRKDSKEQKTRRFDKALERANLEALKLKLLEGGDEEDDDELYEALNKAQLAASQQTNTRFAQLAEDAQQRQKKGTSLPENKELVFTDTTEFCRLFSGENTEMTRQPSELMEEDMETEDTVDVPKTKPDRRRHLRSRVTSEERDTDMKEKEEEKADLGALREPVLGQGLATALSTLRDKGDLREKFEWVGRTNDMKKSRLIGVDDFYTCGEADNRMEKSIETALTRKDHLGRVLTPKEAFREISYAFHGKGPSQKTLEKRKRKMNEDFLATRSNLDQESQLNRLRAVQKVQGNAFVVLSGAEQLGKGIKSKKKKSTKKSKTEAVSKDSFPSLTPILDRADTDAPLEGKNKVEVMFGIQPNE